MHSNINRATLNLHSKKFAAHLGQVCAEAYFSIQVLKKCGHHSIQQTQGHVAVAFCFSIMKEMSIRGLVLSLEGVPGSPFCFLKHVPTRTKGSKSAGMGGIKVTSQRRGSGEANNAASTVNSSIALDLRGLLLIVSLLQ